MYAHGRAAAGFTLVEQIIVVAIAMILIGIAIPSMRGLLRRSQARTATQAVVGALHATRILAIDRQRSALFCPSRDGRHCSGDGAWEHGWLIGIDRNHDNQPDGLPVITRPPLKGVRILASRGRSRVRYHADGSAPGSNLTLRICPRKNIPDKITAVVVSNVGRIRIGRVDATHCPGFKR